MKSKVLGNTDSDADAETVPAANLIAILMQRTHNEPCQK